MNFIVLENTGMAGQEAVEYFLCRLCGASGFKERESLNRLSIQYFVTELLGLSVYLYHYDESDPSCTSYYLDFEWNGREVVDEGIRRCTVDLFMKSLEARNVRWRYEDLDV